MIKKFNLINVATCLLFANLIIAQDYPFQLPPTVKTTINVNTASKENFNNLLLGTNIHDFGTTIEKELIRKFDPITVRFPHGLFSNWYDWEQDKTRLFGTETYRVRKADGSYRTKQKIDHIESIKLKDRLNLHVGIDGLERLNKEPEGNFDMCWTFNMSADGTNFRNGSPVTVARYKDLKKRGFQVKAIELGNENFYPGQRSSIIPNTEDYIARAKSMSKALKALDPNIKVSVPLLRRANSVNPNWNRDLTRDQSYFDAVTVHSYQGNNPDGDEDNDNSFGAALTAREGLRKSIDDYARKVTNKPVWLTEWGVQAGGANGASALGMLDCYMFLSENQNVYERANWFSVNGKLNSFLVFHDVSNVVRAKRDGVILSANGKERIFVKKGEVLKGADGKDSVIVRKRIKYPLEKTSYGMTYEVIRKVFENSTLLGQRIAGPNLTTGVKAVNARAVMKNGKTWIIAVNLMNKPSEFEIKLNGKVYNGLSRHQALAFDFLGQEITMAIDGNPLKTIRNNPGNITLPKLSINVIELKEAGLFVPETAPLALDVAMTAPRNNASFVANTVIALKANASVGNKGISQVNFRVNGAFLKADFTAPYEIQWKPTKAGTYVIDVVAVDQFGRRKVSTTTRTVNVRNDQTQHTIAQNIGGSWYKLKNVETGRYLRSMSTSNTIAASVDSAYDKQWRFIKVGRYYNIDSRSIGDGNGILRAKGADVIGTPRVAPKWDIDKVWTVYKTATGTYRIALKDSERYIVNDFGDDDKAIKLSRKIGDRSMWILESVGSAKQTDDRVVEESVTVFPNPVNDAFTISLQGFEKATVVITDLLGKIVYQQRTTSNNIKVSVGEKFNSGIYLLKVVGDNAVGINKKIVIE